MISRIIKVESNYMCYQPKPKITGRLTGTLIILDVTKTESHNCFIIHCLKKRTVDEANRQGMFLLRV